MAKLILSQDVRGNFKRDMGRKADGKIPRFYLGREKHAALLRSALLEKVWAVIEGEGQAAWDADSLAVAQSVSRGESPITVNPTDERNAGAWLGRLRERFPFLTITLADEGQRERVDEQERIIDGITREMVAGLQTAQTSKQRLYEALDAYGKAMQAQHQTPEKRITPYGMLVIRQIDQIKAQAADMPLSSLNLAAVEGLIQQWANRPTLPRTGKPAAPDTCRDNVKRVRHFVRWLHKAESFAWRLPPDFTVLPVRIRLTPAEVGAKVRVKRFKIAELVTLYKTATPYERALMLLSLNCGFAVAEIATLQLDEITLSDDGKGRITKIRYKSGVLGKWRLWSETVQAIKFLMRRRPESTETALVLTRNGNPLTKPTKGNNRPQHIPNLWQALLRRVRKDDGAFPKLPFKMLRKTGADLIARLSNEVTSSLYLCHGKPTADSLLYRYANRDFRKVFKALARLRKKLAPMFASVENPFPENVGKAPAPILPPATIRRMVSLREQGFKVSKIAEELGVSDYTVRRYTRKQAAQA